MSERIVLTVIGADRPGLVDEVSEFIFARGGSIEDSRMANLQGQFAIVALISGSQEAIDRVTSDLDVLRSQTDIQAQLTPAVRADFEGGQRVLHRLTGRALDQSGLVHQIANLLRSFDVNIESMDTTLEAAPETGSPVFAMDLVIAVPASASLAQLGDELARVCDSLNIDWQLSAL